MSVVSAESVKLYVRKVQCFPIEVVQVSTNKSRSRDHDHVTLSGQHTDGAMLMLETLKQ
jgi:hypothetical protein